MIKGTLDLNLSAHAFRPENKEVIRWRVLQVWTYPVKKG